ncbi:MAG: DUF1569 domain-containing protein [Candidatus Sericytochromatia bacterium]
MKQPLTHATVLERLEKLSAGSAGLWGKMTVCQMLRHLTMDLEIGLGERPAKDYSSLMSTTVMKWMILSAIPFPKNAQTMEELEVSGLSEAPVDFASEKAAYLTTLARFVAAGQLRERQPVLGKMSKAQWLRYTLRHADHHLGQFGV